MLIAENVQWDTEHKMRDTLPEYLEILHDEKMVTVRQCIQALGLIVQKEPAYNKDITEALLAFDIMSVRETMRKLILLDIIHTLIEIRKNYDCSEISNYIFSALSGEILDGKSKKPSKSCCNCSFINVIYWLIYQSDIAIMKEYYVGLKGEATNEV